MKEIPHKQRLQEDIVWDFSKSRYADKLKRKQARGAYGGAGTHTSGFSGKNDDESLPKKLENTPKALIRNLGPSQRKDLTGQSFHQSKDSGIDPAVEGLMRESFTSNQEFFSYPVIPSIELLLAANCLNWKYF